MKAKDLKDKSTDDLNRTVGDLQKDLITFRLKQVTGTVENVRLARAARRDIARIKTILRQRELAAKSEA